MPPLPPTTNGKPAEAPKSWKKINEERKAAKKKRKQEKLIKNLETEEEELAKAAQDVKERKLNPSTVTIAVPGSILEKAQSAELFTYVAGQIARAACIFRVNEVVVFDDIGLSTARETKRDFDAEDAGDDNSASTVRGSSLKLARILQYLECPQYLRKFFFPLHKDLKYCGLLNPLDAPHHLRKQHAFHYREGIVCDKNAKPGFSYVNVGLYNDVLVDTGIKPGVRVTVKLDKTNEPVRKQHGTAVSPDEPRRETGVYWGYNVRIAHTITEIFTKSPYEGGYDLTLGTSDRGSNVNDVPDKSYAYNHALIVFGGLMGLETALTNDEQLNVDDPALLFDHYINVLPKQGSRTIRTEEALLIAMSVLQSKLKPIVEDVEEDGQLEKLLPRSEDTGAGRPPLHAGGKKQKKQREQTPEEVRLDKSDLADTAPLKRRRTETDAVLRGAEELQTKLNDAKTLDGRDDFEVVPAAEVKKTKTKSAKIDLSRFD